jgi:hypothetical protein
MIISLGMSYTELHESSNALKQTQERMLDSICPDSLQIVS